MIYENIQIDDEAGHIIFSTHAQDVLCNAKKIARDNGVSCICPNMLLLGLLQGSRGLGLSAIYNQTEEIDALIEMVQYDMKASIENVLRAECPEDFYLSSVAQEVIRCGLDEARNLQHGFFGTEHFLLGILRTDSSAADNLRHFNVTLNAVRAYIARQRRNADKMQITEESMLSVEETGTTDVPAIDKSDYDKAVTASSVRETFDGGAVRDKTDYRYDLMSPSILLLLLHRNHHAHNFAKILLAYVNNETSAGDLVDEWLGRLLDCSMLDIAHLYAQALHDGAGKYGERNWEKGIPESNLLNHALHHLFRLGANDQSENHKSHLVWNVLTLIHFHETAKEVR